MSVTKISDSRSYNGCLNSLLILYVYRRLTCLQSAPLGSLLSGSFPWLPWALFIHAVQYSFTTLVLLYVVFLLVLMVALSVLNFLMRKSLFMLSLSMPLTGIRIGTPSSSFFALAPRDSSGALICLFKEYCVVDVWRHLHPHSSAFTWLRPDGSFSSQIDLVSCPLPWLHYVESCNIIPCTYLDHAAVLFVCPIPVPLPQGPGRWKFNVSVLEEAAFIQEGEALWASWALRKPSSLLHSWWDQG